MWRCAHGCEHQWLHPQPDQKTLERAYQTYYTHQSVTPPRLKGLYESMRQAYLARRFGYGSTRTSLVTRLGAGIISLIPHRRVAFDASVLWQKPLRAGRLLELGCGNGERLARLSTLGWSVVGVEADPQAAELAASHGLQVINGDALAQDFPPDSFDAIIMSHVIEHVRDPEGLIAHCRSWLKAGGQLTLLTPNLSSLGHRLFRKHWLHLDPPRHLHIFSQQSLTAMCLRAGFSDVASSTSFRDANWTLAASVRLRGGKAYRVGQLPLHLRLLGLAMLYVEWLGMKIRPDVGEEVLLFARKPAPSWQEITPINANGIQGNESTVMMSLTNHCALQ
ncbi:hypothetical protein GCM10025770_16460 [Viridibacterium curvum]|uniref:Class I SAM-dependent methyltransferase n=2 Tax=Viridibacterium curvum TaxID=1101404 RepID=A0ABP9QL84_9RHOO